MQKVVGASPISRFEKPVRAGLSHSGFEPKPSSRPRGGMQSPEEDQKRQDVPRDYPRQVRPQTGLEPASPAIAAAAHLRCVLARFVSDGSTRRLVGLRPPGEGIDRERDQGDPDQGIPNLDGAAGLRLLVVEWSSHCFVPFDLDD